MRITEKTGDGEGQVLPSLSSMRVVRDGLSGLLFEERVFQYPGAEPYTDHQMLSSFVFEGDVLSLPEVEVIK